MGGDRAGDGSAWYVLEKDLTHNTLIVDQGHDHPALLSRQVHAMDASWISGSPPPADATLSAKTRYRQQDGACRIQPKADRFDLIFESPQWAVTPGQSAVLYDGPICLGGGIIAAKST